LPAAFNLINDIDVAETEARIAQYRAANAAMISANAQRDAAAAQALRDAEELDRLERQERARELARGDAEEREERARERRDLIDRLEVAQNPEEARRAVERLRRHHALQQQQQQQGAASLSSARLLGRRAAQSTAVPDVPHVPLQDSYYGYEDRYAVKEAYDDPWSDAVRRDKEGIMRAGGYRVEEAWERAIRSTVAGLDLMPLSGLHPVAEGLVDAGGDVVMASA
jgi:CDK-activating kinase assembly factor MAT1